MRMQLLLRPRTYSYPCGAGATDSWTFRKFFSRIFSDATTAPTVVYMWPRLSQGYPASVQEWFDRVTHQSVAGVRKCHLSCPSRARAIQLGVRLFGCLAMLSWCFRLDLQGLGVVAWLHNQCLPRGHIFVSFLSTDDSLILLLLLLAV